MDWWVWVLVIVALVVTAWAVRRSRAGKRAVRPNQSAIGQARKRDAARTFRPMS